MSSFDRHDHQVILQPSATTLAVEEMSLTVDEQWTPYAQGTIVAKVPADRDVLDLRTASIFVDLRLQRSFGVPWQVADLTADLAGSVAALTAVLGGLTLARLSNEYFIPFTGSTVRAGERLDARLLVVDRQIDERTQLVTLTVESLEAQLIGDRLATSSSWDPASTSLRTIVEAVIERYEGTLDDSALDATVAEADATIWKPGVAAADYLAPMLEAASLRLWVDLDGTWYLDARESLRPGTVAVAESRNMTEYVDRMTLQADQWCDAVIVDYRWTDSLDLQRVEYDVAGEQPARAALHIVRDAIYPGPGAAAGILARAQARGRQLDLGAVSTYLARPGMAAIITPLVGDVSTGIVSSITWQLPQAEMKVRARGLTDTPATAYVFGPTGYSYLDVPLGVDYTEFDWSTI